VADRHHTDGAAYEERRRLSVTVGLLLTAVTGITVWFLVDIARNQPERLWSSVLFGFCFLAPLYVVLLTPRVSGEFSHLRVDERGLWVRNRLLPAEQMGAVSVLGDAETFAAHVTTRTRGMSRWRGVNAYSPFLSDGTAVLVEQLRPDARKVPWTLGTRHPRELTAALHATRDAARRLRDGAST